MYAVAKLPAKPAAPATLLDTPKNRPRSCTGIVRAMISIHAGMRAPPVPVITRSMTSMRASVAAGARSATVKARMARIRKGTRSAPV